MLWPIRFENALARPQWICCLKWQPKWIWFLMVHTMELLRIANINIWSCKTQQPRRWYIEYLLFKKTKRENVYVSIVCMQLNLSFAKTHFFVVVATNIKTTNDGKIAFNWHFNGVKKHIFERLQSLGYSKYIFKENLHFIISFNSFHTLCCFVQCTSLHLFCDHFFGIKIAGFFLLHLVLLLVVLFVGLPFCLNVGYSFKSVFAVLLLVSFT